MKIKNTTNTATEEPEIDEAESTKLEEAEPEEIKSEGREAKEEEYDPETDEILKTIKSLIESLERLDKTGIFGNNQQEEEEKEVPEQSNPVEKNTTSETFYFPIEAEYFMHRDVAESPIPLPQSELILYENVIREHLMAETAFDHSLQEIVLDNIGDEELTKKISNLYWSAEAFGGRLYGTVTVFSHGSLTQKEIDELAKEISAQNSDGFGEGFEQRAITVKRLLPGDINLGLGVEACLREMDISKLPDFDIYVQLWTKSDSYKILPEDKFFNEILSEKIEDEDRNPNYITDEVGPNGSPEIEEEEMRQKILDEYKTFFEVNDDTRPEAELPVDLSAEEPKEVQSHVF